MMKKKSDIESDQREKGGNTIEGYVWSVTGWEEEKLNGEQDDVKKKKKMMMMMMMGILIYELGQL